MIYHLKGKWYLQQHSHLRAEILHDESLHAEDATLSVIDSKEEVSVYGQCIVFSNLTESFLPFVMFTIPTVWTLHSHNCEHWQYWQSQHIITYKPKNTWLCLSLENIINTLPLS